MPGPGTQLTPMATNTSWEKSSKWYAKSVGNRGQYYHQHIVIPNSLKLLSLYSNSSLIDLACGQGILARSIPKNTKYLGLDVSSSLINEAKKISKHEFAVVDVAKKININEKFSHAAIILSLQNIENQEQVIENALNLLESKGKLLMVLNHPAFRIPRQSSWEIDPQNKLEYRRINRYLSPLKIPISTHPGEQNSPITWSFHHPLSHYFSLLKKYNFVVTDLEEWASDKESRGKNSKMENKARSEFPLFLAILAKKNV